MPCGCPEANPHTAKTLCAAKPGIPYPNRPPHNIARSRVPQGSVRIGVMGAIANSATIQDQVAFANMLDRVHLNVDRRSNFMPSFSRKMLLLFDKANHRRD
jgi:hypothetical protein